MAYHLNPQKFRIFLLKAKPVVFLFLVPVLKANHQVNVLGILDAGYTEKGLHIHDADTPKLNKVLGNIGCGAHQRFLAHTTDFHRVVGHQTMPSLNQLQRRLGFTDAALPRNQNALAVNIHQHAVNGDAGRQPYIQPFDNFGGKGGGGLLCFQKGNFIFHCNLLEKVIRFQIPAEHNCRDIEGQKLSVNLLLALLRHRLHIAVLHKTDNLYSDCLEMLKIAGQLQCRPVNVRLGNLNL